MQPRRGTDRRVPERSARTVSVVTERSPHPWNRGFEWRDHAGPFRTVTEQQARQYDEAGYFVIEGAFDVDTITRLRSELEAGDEQIRDFLGQLPDGRFHVAAWTPRWWRRTTSCGRRG